MWACGFIKPTRPKRDILLVIVSPFEGYLDEKFVSLTYLDTNFAMLLMVAFGCVGMRLYYAWRNRRGGAGDGLDFKY